MARQRSIDAMITDFMSRSQNKQTVPVCCGICCIEDAPGDLVIENLLDRANFARKTVKNGVHADYAFYTRASATSCWRKRPLSVRCRRR